METEQKASEPKPRSAKPKTNPLILVVAAVLLLAVGGAGGYAWRGQAANKQAKRLEDEKTQLQNRVDGLEKELIAEKSQRQNHDHLQPNRF